MSDLTIGVRELSALVKPVVPCAGDDATLPALRAVEIRTDGPWLIATATDRFRIAVLRLRSPEGDWPEFYALVPTSSLRSLLATFKPTRGVNPEIVLSAEGDRLRVKSGGAFDGFFDASMSFLLETVEFPKQIPGMIVKALAGKPAPVSANFNFKFLSAFAAADPHGEGLHISTAGGPSDPLVVTDGANFLGMVMPKRRATEIDATEWTALLTPKAEVAA